MTWSRRGWASAAATPAAAAKDRHPASAWRPDLDRFRARMAERLVEEGSRWPDFVAAVLQTRARLGVDQAGLAELLGVDTSVVADMEASRLPPSQAPLGLAALAPDIDWAALVDGSAERS